MNVQELLSQARDNMTVKRVFGDPIEKDGLTVIPVASVVGGAGGGSGESQDEGAGSGAGYGLVARPAGAYIIKDGEVSWQPALDVNRVILGGQIVAVVVALTIGSVIRARIRARGDDS